MEVGLGKQQEEFEEVSGTALKVNSSIQTFGLESWYV